MSDYVVGVSGGIGSGKTTVTDLFAQKGIVVIDADLVARQVVEPGTEALDKISVKFGADVLLADGTLDRSALRELIFQQPELKNWLNALLHPAIRTEMTQQTLQAGSAYCIQSVPLLVENQLHKLVDRVLIVDVSEQTQIARTTQRDDVNEQQVQAIMQAQASREQRLAVADDVIENNADKSLLSKQIDALHKKYLVLATQKTIDKKVDSK